MKTIEAYANVKFPSGIIEITWFDEEEYLKHLSYIGYSLKEAIQKFKADMAEELPDTEFKILTPQN